MLDVRVAAVFGLDRATGDPVVVAVSGDTELSHRPEVVFPEAAGMIDLAVRDRQPVLTPDILMEPRVSLTPELRAAIEAAQYHAVLAVPLIVQDRVIGALGVGDLAGRSFGAEEIEIVRAFADQAAIVLENHQLYGELREALTAVRSSQEQLVATERLQAVGTLAAGVTHYVNNVLQAVLGSAQLLLRESTEPGVRKRLETLERTTMDAADIMRRVKSFTEATTLSDAMPLDLNQLVRDLLAARATPWAPLISAGTIEMDFEPGEISEVLALPAPLREVLVALILNAVEALPGGGRSRAPDVGHARGRLLRGRRFRQGSVRRGAAPRARALLHHEGPSPPGARAEHGVRDHPAPPRRAGDSAGRRAGRHRDLPSAASPSQGGRP